MADLNMHVTVTRTLLGLDPLDINDHANYYLGPQSLGAQVQWNRNQVTSPFLDGSVTTWRARQQVMEPVTVEVLGSSAEDLKTKVGALVDAFVQDVFTLSVIIDTVTEYAYHCEASDYQVSWTGPRMLARQAQVTFNVPRRPISLTGSV